MFELDSHTSQEVLMKSLERILEPGCSVSEKSLAAY